eukprot:1184331-Prorocentrum_minimum.AAC.1
MSCTLVLPVVLSTGSGGSPAARSYLRSSTTCSTKSPEAVYTRRENQSREGTRYSNTPASPVALRLRRPSPICGGARRHRVGSPTHRGGAVVDVKGYSVDVKGYSVDVKGYSVDVKGYVVDD